MLAVISSDYHTDRKTQGFDRYDEIRAAAHQTVDVAIAEKADLWAFLGDLCDPSDGAAVARGVELTLEIALRLRGARIRSVWLSGNHCPYEDGSGRTVLSPLRALASDVDDLLFLFETPGSWLSLDGVRVVALPYPPASRPFDLAECAVKEISKGGYRTGLVLGHATEIPGAVEGEETHEMPRGRGVPFPIDVIPKGWVMANGHMHTPQVTPDGVLIPGALARLTRGERANDPRFLLVDV